MAAAATGQVPTGAGTQQLLAATENHPHARALLTAALAGEPSHSWIFHGPRGVGKTDAARAFAAALLAEGAHDPEHAVERALHGAHPDLTWVEPSGAHEMRKEDVDNPVVVGATRTPMEGARRVFVIDRAETMSSTVANKLLKTLEEPSPHAHFILISSQLDRVIGTIVSRCQPVRFDAIPVEQLAAQLTAEGVEAERAISAAALSAGDVELARELATEEGDAMRSEAGRIVGCALRGVGARERPWSAVLDRAVEAGELGEQRVLAKLEEDLEVVPKGRERTALQKEGEERATRVSRRLRRDTLDASLRICSLLLRDIAASAAGASDLVLARDRYDSIVRSAGGRPVGPLLDAAAEVEATRRTLLRNVSEELALEALSVKLERLLIRR